MKQSKRNLLNYLSNNKTKKLYDYQIKIWSFLKETPRAVLAVDMGLGKTAAVLHYLDEISPPTAVIVAPKFVARFNWKQEALNWGLTELADKMVIVEGVPAKRFKLLMDTTKPYKIIPVGVISDIKDLYTDVLILDELTLFKNPTSQRSLLIQSVKSTIRIGLTGTFIANGAIDIFGQLAAVGLEKNKIITYNNGYTIPVSFQNWRGLFFKNVMKGSGQPFEKWVRQVNLSEIIEPHKERIITLAAEDYLKVPDVFFNYEIIELTKEEEENYIKLDATLSVNIDEVEYSINERGKVAKLQTLCNGFIYDKEGETIKDGVHTKLFAVLEKIELLKNLNEPLILVYNFKGEKDFFEVQLKKKKINYITSTTPGFVNIWNNKKCDVLMIHPASCGHGLNLQTGGRYMIFSTLPLSYELWQQSIARIVRTGQSKKTFIISFLAKNTVETKYYRSLLLKKKENEAFKSLTKE